MPKRLKLRSDEFGEVEKFVKNLRENKADRGNMEGYQDQKEDGASERSGVGESEVRTQHKKPQDKDVNNKEEIPIADPVLTKDDLIGKTPAQAVQIPTSGHKCPNCGFAVQEMQERCPNPNCGVIIEWQ